MAATRKMSTRNLNFNIKRSYDEDNENRPRAGSVSSHGSEHRGDHRGENNNQNNASSNAPSTANVNVADLMQLLRNMSEKLDGLNANKTQ
jgi:hypothetical protein